VEVPGGGWVRFSKQGGNWDDTFTLNISVGYYNSYIYEVYKEVAYTAAGNKTGSAFRSGDIVATHVVDRFHADVSGAKDPDGSYGGIGSVIERPDNVLRHFLVERAGFSPDDIDAASFDAAGAEFAAAGYALAFRLDRNIVPSRLAAEMARGCRSALGSSGGRLRLTWLPDSAPEALKSISEDELAGKGSAFNFDRTPLEDVANAITARYRRNYVRLKHDSAWDATSTASDAASQTKYGPYPREADFEFIRDSAMADSVLAQMLLSGKEPRLAAEFPVFWDHFDLAPGDTVELDSPVYGVRRFMVSSVRRTDRFRAVVTATEWW